MKTNEFQRLVGAVKGHLAPGCKVTEPAMVPDLQSGTNREVDVWIETSVAKHVVFVAIECIDHTRKADVTWVEQMKCKHDHLPTSLLVLVSRRGFTKGAIEKAALFGIQTEQLTELADEIATRIVGKIDLLWLKIVGLSVERVSVELEVDGKAAGKMRVERDHKLFTQQGNECGLLLLELVQHFVRMPEIGQELLSRGLKEHTWFTAGRKFPNEPAPGLYMRREQDGALHRVLAIEVVGRCEFQISQFGLKHGRLGEIPVSWGRSLVQGRDMLLVVSEADGSQYFSIVDAPKSEMVEDTAAQAKSPEL